MKDTQAALWPLEINPDVDAPDSDLRGKTRATDQYISSIWSFPGSGGEQLYRWYGTLPRQLVERLISLYASDSQTRVLEPFMGLGTTLDVAASAGSWALGIDSNPLACLATETRLFGVPSKLETIEIARRVSDRVMRQATISSSEGTEEWSEHLEQARYAYMRKWFRPDTLASTLRLLYAIAEVEDPRIQRLLFVTAAQVVRDVASVDSRCTHHLVTKSKPFIEPLNLWRDRVPRVLDAVRTAPADPSRIQVKQGSALQPEFDDHGYGFALAHPPYLGVIHYHLIHRLATDLLHLVSVAKSPLSLNGYSFDYGQLKADDVSTDNTGPYVKFVQEFAKAMSQNIIHGGRCAVIIGDQRYKGNLRHPFTDFIREFEAEGFLLEENFIWVLQNNGGMHVLRRGHFIDHNYILVFRKTGE